MKKVALGALTALALACLAPPLAFPDSFNYQVTVDTSSLAGTAGNLDFQFVPGVPSPLPASATIINFTGGTLAATPSTFGLVSGSFLNGLTFENSAAGDWYQPFIYGNTLSFTVAFNNTPNPALGGNSFAFSMFDNAPSPNPVLTTNLVNGFAFTVSLPGQGNPVLTNYSQQTKLVSFTPEPAAGTLVLIGILSILGLCSKYPETCAGALFNVLRTTRGP